MNRYTQYFLLVVFLGITSHPYGWTDITLETQSDEYIYDALVYEHQPDFNFGNDEVMAISTSSTSGFTQRSFLSFDIRKFLIDFGYSPENYQLNHIEIILTIQREETNWFFPIEVRFPEEPWNENTINWTNQPSFSAIEYSYDPGKHLGEKDTISNDTILSLFQTYLTDTNETWKKGILFTPPSTWVDHEYQIDYSTSEHSVIDQRPKIRFTISPINIRIDKKVTIESGDCGTAVETLFIPQDQVVKWCYTIMNHGPAILYDLAVTDDEENITDLFDFEDLDGDTINNDLSGGKEVASSRPSVPIHFSMENAITSTVSVTARTASSDGEILTDYDTVRLYLTSDNPQFLSTFDNQTILEDSATNPIAFSVSGSEGGLLQVSGSSSNTTIIPNDNILLTDLGWGSWEVVVTPAANQNGGPVTITLIAEDPQGGVGYQTFDVTVLPVNDAPSFVKGKDHLVIRGSGEQIVPQWATHISAGPADETNQKLSFIIAYNTNPGLFTSEPVIASDGILTYTPALEADSWARITVMLIDDGGTANGGQDTFDQTFYIITVTSEYAVIIYGYPGGQYPKQMSPTKEFLLLSESMDPERFGQSISISGNTMVVCSDRGTYIYERNEGGMDNWGLVKVLPVIGEGVISGDTLLVDTYIFERNEGGENNWGLVKVLPGGGSAISGDRIIRVSYTGIYIFERNEGGVNNWGVVTVLPGGNAASMSEDRVVVGSSSGVYLYERDEGGTGQWGMVKQLTASDGVTGDDFGSSVAISGDTVVVGAPGAPVILGDDIIYIDGPPQGFMYNFGGAYIFERNAGGINQWGQVKKLLVSELSDNNSLGTSVAISGDRVVVGAPRVINYHSWDPSPAAFVFGRNIGGVNQWGCEAKLRGRGFPGSSTDFGSQLAISGDTVAVCDNSLYGAMDIDSIEYYYSGAAYVYGFISDNPRFIGTFDDQTILEDSSTVPISFSVIGSEEAVIQVSGSSSDTTIIPNENILLTNLAGGNWEVVITPAENLNGGPVTITLIADDPHGAISQQTFDVTVLPVNDAPVALGDNYSTDEDTPVNINLSGIDVDGDPLTFSIVTLPAHGSLTGIPPTLTYTPSQNYSGPDSFTFMVNDGQVDSDEAALNINVIQGNATPLPTVTPTPTATHTPTPTITPSPLPSSTVYEDAEDGTTLGWTVYDSTPAGASISNVLDLQTQSRVIQLSGSITNNGYMLLKDNNIPWNNTTQFVARWSMKYGEYFLVYIDVQTTAGHRYLQYEPVNTNRLGTDEYVLHGLGTGARNGQWQTFERNLQLDLQEAQPAAQILQVNAFLIRGSGYVDNIMLLSSSSATPTSTPTPTTTSTPTPTPTITPAPIFTPSPVPPSTVYEDAEDGTTLGWTVYDNTPAGASISNVLDLQTQSRVIQLNGSITNNGYMLLKDDTTSWNNTTQFVARWSMKYGEYFLVYIDVLTTAGHRYLQYEPVNTNRLGTDEYVLHGLGTGARNGQWQTFERNLQLDLQEAQPTAQILQVNAFLIRGSGYVDNIMLLSSSSATPTSTPTPTTTSTPTPTVTPAPIFTPTPVPPSTVYENAEDGATLGWTVYDNTPTGASISNVLDLQTQSRVIQLSGSITNNGYMLRSDNNTPWNNTTQFVARWSMKYGEYFLVYFDVLTTAGHRYLQYEPVNTNGLGTGDYVLHGLGTGARNGQWQTFERNLHLDLQEAQPAAQILQVNAFLIRGSGYVDNIMLLSSNSSSLTSTPTPTPPATPTPTSTTVPGITIPISNLPSDAKPLEMVLIPAGTFIMGSPNNEQDRDINEGPQHQVTLTKPFYMGRCEVTQAQWQAIMGSNPSHFEGHNLPVEMVSWNDCQAFIQALNQVGPGTFRLPTEAEWEYACRAGTTTRFYWGDDPDNSQIGQYAWYGGNSSSWTHEVGTKLPNAWGLHDMSGNVWEWCQDWFGDYPSSPQTDPLGPASGSFKMVRGGMNGLSAYGCRSAVRIYSYPVDFNNGFGFRVASDDPLSTPTPPATPTPW